jgi:hypothetical protein
MNSAKGVFTDLAVIALLWAIMAALINPVGNFPINDDWTYGLAVAHILKEGSFALPSGSTANVLVHAYWGALFCLPFGFDYTALRISTLVFALFGLWAAYGTARELGARRSLALMTAATFAVAPLYLPLAATFMTDVPFTNIVGVALYCFTRGICRTRPRYIMLGFAIALMSVLLRQFGLIFVGAFGVAIVVRSRFSPGSILILSGTALLGLSIHLGFQHWMMGTHRTVSVAIASTASFGPGLDPKQMGIAIAKMLVLLPYVGVMLLPLYCATGFATSRSFLRQRPIAGAVVALLMLAGQFAGAWNRQMHFPDYGNGLTRYGIGPMLIYDRSILGINLPVEPFPSWVWQLLSVAGAITVSAIMIDLTAATMRLGHFASRRQPYRAAWADATALVSIGLYGLLVCMMSVNPAAYDRYMLVFLVPATLLLLAHADGLAAWTTLRLLSAGALILLFGAFSIAATSDYLAWQRERHHATTDLARIGISPDRIDGGYEYNGNIFYAVAGIGWHLPFKRSWWWVQDDAYVIGAGPVPHYRIVRRYPFYRLLTRSWDQVVVLRRLPASRGEIDNYRPAPGD